MSQFRSFIFFLAILGFLSPLYTQVYAENEIFPKDERTQRIFKQEQLIHEGNVYVEQGQFDEALSKYNEALKPSVLNDERDKGNAIYYIEKVYKLQGKYEKALKKLQWSIDQNPNGKGWINEKLELEALIKARDTNSPQPIYDHIEYLKKKYKDQLPPNAGAYSDTIAAAIIRLYDYIGDHDQGIEFVAGFLKRCADGLTCKGEERKLAYTPKHPLFSIKQAFEQDKTESFKGCINSKPGEVCMGKATKALIQSHNLPW